MAIAPCCLAGVRTNTKASCPLLSAHWCRADVAEVVDKTPRLTVRAAHQAVNHRSIARWAVGTTRLMLREALERVFRYLFHFAAPRLSRGLFIRDEQTSR